MHRQFENTSQVEGVTGIRLLQAVREAYATFAFIKSMNPTNATSARIVKSVRRISTSNGNELQEHNLNFSHAGQDASPETEAGLGKC